jgi:hypothetical protein
VACHLDLYSKPFQKISLGVQLRREARVDCDETFRIATRPKGWKRRPISAYCNHGSALGLSKTACPRIGIGVEFRASEGVDETQIPMVYPVCRDWSRG